MSNEAEDPIVVCIKVYHTQTKELDAKSFAPRPLSRTAAWYRYRSDSKPDCKVSAIVDGKTAKVDGWKGSAGTRFVRVGDAPGCIVAMLTRKRKFLERQLASYDAVIANPLAVIPQIHEVP